MPARGLILAAGRGSRLGPLTRTRPKCLVELAGRSLLDWQRSALFEAGVADVGIVLGYEAGAVAEVDDQVFENLRWASTQMVRSLLCAATWLRRAECIVVYGDLAFHPDIVRSLLRDPRSIAFTFDREWRRLWAERFTDPADDAESLCVRANRLVSMGRPRPDLDTVSGQYMGILKITPAGLRRIEDWIQRQSDASRVDALHMSCLLDALAHDGVEIGAVPVRGRWVEVDSPGDLRLYERRVERRQAGEDWSHDWRWQ